MKKNVVLAFLCIFLLVGLVSCREANEFEETTLTLVNATDYTIDLIEIRTYVGYSDRSMSYNALPDGMELEPEGSLLFALPPILAENTNMRIGVEYVDDDSSGYIDREFTYREGAEVILTFIPAESDTESPSFSIEGGKLVEYEF